VQIRQLMQPRRRVKDLYDKINEPDSGDDETTKGKEGSLHISKAI